MIDYNFIGFCITNVLILAVGVTAMVYADKE